MSKVLQVQWSQRGLSWTELYSLRFLRLHRFSYAVIVGNSSMEILILINEISPVQFTVSEQDYNREEIIHRKITYSSIK